MEYTLYALKAPPYSYLREKSPPHKTWGIIVMADVQQNSDLRIIALAEYKRQHGLTALTVVKGKGRRFVPLGSTTLMIPDKTDLKAPLYVITNGAHHETGTLWLVNTAAQATGDTI